MEHIGTARLLDLVTKYMSPDPREKDHLQICAECGELFKVFTRHFSSTEELRRQPAGRNDKPPGKIASGF